MKKIIIVGATSGLGYELAKLYVAGGWRVGIAGRRENILKEIQEKNPSLIEYEVIDVTKEDAPEKLNSLITKLGGMDVFLLSSGVGQRNPDLQLDAELKTFKTNVLGFSTLVVSAYNYFSSLKQGGHIAVISSIAGTKGIGAAASYSSSKRFQSTYINALAQLSRNKKQNISFSDIRPGFVATDILKKDEHYPMLMQADYAAKIIMNAIDNKKRVKIVNWKFAIFVFFWKLIPQWLWERLKVGAKS